MAEVDIYSPFRKRPEGHEDRLTWGFMVTLKYVPELQQLLRESVLRRLPTGKWPTSSGWEPAAVATQAHQLGTGASFVVSILLSDAFLGSPVEVQKSERGARYDGVVEYSDGLVLIIENKPHHTDVWPGQLSPGLASFGSNADAVEVFERAISLEWAEILEGILNYAGSEVASYSAKHLARDFLGFVEDLHPHLSPYRTFELCGHRREALDRRIEALIESLGRGLGFDVGFRPGSKPYLDLPNEVVRQVHLTVDRDREGNSLVLRQSIWPGDTVRQARAFLERVDQDAFLSLPDASWKVRTNLHYSHMQKHLVWAETSLSVSDYLAYFATHPEEIGRRQFEEVTLSDLCDRWRDVGLVSDSDVESLHHAFGETRRSFLNVIPGFELTREWSMSDIIVFESEHRLERTLVESLREPLSTWGETLPDWLAT